MAALLPSRYVRERIQTQTGQRNPERPLNFEPYFGRLLIESKRIAATSRRSQEACGDEVLPGQPHATPGPSSCPNGGGDLALTLRRSVRERCVCCATQITPRAWLFTCVRPSCYVHERIQIRIERLKLTHRTPLILEFYLGRLLTEFERIAATYPF